jgi:hypothetical protein
VAHTSGLRVGFWWCHLHSGIWNQTKNPPLKSIKDGGPQTPSRNSKLT